MADRAVSEIQPQAPGTIDDETPEEYQHQNRHSHPD
jgi:hypothetical protein